MSSMLPFVALLSVEESRRSQLLPLALTSMAGMPGGQAGALAVVSADSAVRIASAEATSAITALLALVVARDCRLTAEDVAHIPLVAQVVAANPDILTTSSADLERASTADLEGASTADLERAMTVIQEAMTKGGEAKPTGDSEPSAAEAKAPRSTAKR
jgi:hypothetical protein